MNGPKLKFNFREENSLLLPAHINLLEETSLFSSINPSQYELLLEQFDYRLECLNTNEEITKEITDIGILLSGSIKIYKENIDRNLTLVDEVKVGEVFGDVFACLNSNDSIYKIIADADATFILIPYNNLLAPTGYKDQFTMLSNLMRLLARKNLLAERKLEILTKRSISDKILTFLSIQRDITGENTFVIPYSRTELSDYLCVDRSALSRELSNLMKSGLIKYKKNLFTLMTSYDDVDTKKFDEIASQEGFGDAQDDDMDYDEYQTTYEPTLDEIHGNLKNIPEFDFSEFEEDDVDYPENLLKQEPTTENLPDYNLDELENQEYVPQISVEQDQHHFGSEFEQTSDHSNNNQESYQHDEYYIENEDDDEFISDINFFGGRISQDAEDDYDPAEEVSAMDEEQQVRQTKIFAKFIQQAKSIASQTKSNPPTDEDDVVKLPDESVEIVSNTTNADNFYGNVVENPLYKKQETHGPMKDLINELVEKSVEEHKNQPKIQDTQSHMEAAAESLKVKSKKQHKSRGFNLFEKFRRD